MNIKELGNKTILIFGKSRAFSTNEFQLQIKAHKINLVNEYSDDISLVVEGKLMTPYELNESALIYKEKKVDFINIDTFDKELADYIDEDTLFMSLKLSRDKDRLKDYISNAMISDELFLKIVKLYSWQGEDFFENDSNRDVSAAFINRFYENIERNHNVQYASTGFLHLLLQSNDENLIETIAQLEPLQKSFQHNSKDSNYKLITSVARHNLTPKRVLKKLIKNSNLYVKTLIAMRDDCDEEMQKELFNSNDEDVLLALSYNSNLNIDIAMELMKNSVYQQNIAKYINLNEKFFDIFYDNLSLNLAQNESINRDMQRKIIDLNDIEVIVALTQNVCLHKDFVEELILKKEERINISLYQNASLNKDILVQAYEDITNYLSLANNKNTPEDILKKLSSSQDVKVLLALAKNESTPIDILYQLQLDSRLQRAVNENSAFGKHIQTQNIGWIL